MVCYLNFVFFVIMINNLVVISLVKYLLICKNFYMFGIIVVCRMIIGVWILGIVIMLFLVVIFDGVVVCLNDSYFIVICCYN